MFPKLAAVWDVSGREKTKQVEQGKQEVEARRNIKWENQREKAIDEMIHNL